MVLGDAAESYAIALQQLLDGPGEGLHREGGVTKLPAPAAVSLAQAAVELIEQDQRLRSDHTAIRKVDRPAGPIDQAVA